MGGDTVEGSLRMSLDGGASGGWHKSRPAISVGRVLIDVLWEESSHGKQWIFKSLASELVDETHHPPNIMAASTRPSSDAFWETVSSALELSFCLKMLVNMGSSRYRSEQARIRYMICTTLAVKIAGVQHLIRKSLEKAVVSLHDHSLLFYLQSPSVSNANTRRVRS